MRVLKNRPDFSIEEKKWQEGIEYIAGLDEVGRGSFAGPVVAGCAVFDQSTEIPDEVRIDDSKRLTPNQRKEAEVWIKENAVYCSVGEVHAKVINRLGMSKATYMAFRKAVRRANKMAENRIEFLLVDAFFVPYLRGFPASKKMKQKAVKKGDSKSFSIAAASIIAKEYRDNLMRNLANKNPFDKYLWHKNKGYGTREHGQAIKKYGITGHHRVKFVETYLKNEGIA